MNVGKLLFLGYYTESAVEKINRKLCTVFLMIS